MKRYKDILKEHIYFGRLDIINDEDKPYIIELIEENLLKLKFKTKPGDVINIFEEVISNHDAGEDITDKMIIETIKAYFEWE